MRMKFSCRLLASTCLAFAQPPVSADELQLEEIVVTAQKRSGLLQQTPISLVTLDSAALESLGLREIGDLRSAVPQLQLVPHPNAATTLRTYMRGVGNNDEQILQDPSVAVYLDGVYLSRTQGLATDLVDLVRVEVLRGPQGTLYGRNATGGAVNLVTHEPQPGEWSLRQQLTTGSRDQLRLATAANLPLGEQAAARISYQRSREDGFVENRGTGTARFGDQARESGRLDVLWHPDDALAVRYVRDFGRIDDTPTFTGRATLAPQSSPRPHEGSPFVRDLQANDIDIDGHALTLGWTLGNGHELRSISARRDIDDFQNQDVHSGSAGPLPLFLTRASGEQRQWSQELQWLGESGDGRIEFIAGAFWLREEMERESANIVPARGTAALVFGRDLMNESLAVFGEATWTPTGFDDRLQLSAGLRRSRDEREVTLVRGTRQLLSGSVTLSPLVGEGDRNFSNLSPSAGAMWELRDGVRAYLELATGYKSGGFNARASSITRFNEGFDDETMRSIEVGLKSEWWDRRLRLNAAAFRSDYEDIQVIVQSDPDNVLVSDMLNAGRATIDGLEAELSAIVGAGLSVELRIGLLDAGFNEVEDANGADVAQRYRFVHAPERSASLDLRYELPVSPAIGNLAAELSWTWQDEVWSNSSIDAGEFLIEDYGLWNARLVYEAPPLPAGTLRLALWGRNLRNEEYYLAHFNAGIPSAFWGSPRSVGLDVIYSL